MRHRQIRATRRLYSTLAIVIGVIVAMGACGVPGADEPAPSTYPSHISARPTCLVGLDAVGNPTIYDRPVLGGTVIAQMNVGEDCGDGRVQAWVSAMRVLTGVAPVAIVSVCDAAAAGESRAASTPTSACLTRTVPAPTAAGR